MKDVKLIDNNGIRKKCVWAEIGNYTSGLEYYCYYYFYAIYPVRHFLKTDKGNAIYIFFCFFT